MANDFLKNMPPSLKSLWRLENELRRALQNAVLLRREDASENLEEARQHMEAAVQAVRGEQPHHKGPAPSAAPPSKA